MIVMAEGLITGQSKHKLLLWTHEEFMQTSHLLECGLTKPACDDVLGVLKDSVDRLTGT